MPTMIEELRAKVLELPLSDRYTLAHDLLESCDEEIREDEVDEMWAEVITARLEAMDRGESVPVSREVALRRIDEMVASKRRQS